MAVCRLTLSAIFIALSGCATITTPRLLAVNPNLARIGNAETLHVTFDHVPIGSQLSVIPNSPHVLQKVPNINRHAAFAAVGATLWRQTSSTSLAVSSTETKTLVPQFAYSEAEGIHLWSVNEGTLAIVTTNGKLKLFAYDAKQVTPLETLNLVETPQKISVADDHVCLVNGNNSVTLLQTSRAGAGAENATQRRRAVAGDIMDISAFEFGCAVLTRQNEIIVQYAQADVDESKYTLQTAATHVVAHKGLLHIANTGTGYTLLDITEPGKITWLSSYHKAGTVVDVAVEGNTVSLLADDGTVSVLNIAQTDNPTLVSDYFFAPKAQQFDFANNLAFISDSNTLSIIDFSSSSTPNVSSLGASWGGSRRSDIASNTLYVADWFSGLHLYDIGRSELSHIATVHTTGSAKGVLVRGHIAYVGDDDQGLQVVDVRDPSRPKMLAQLPLPGLAYTMDLHGNTLYLAGHHGGFYIIDVTKPEQPAILGRYDTTGKAWAIRVVDKIAYVADDKSGVLIFDVANPANIVPIGEFNPGGQAEDIIIDYPRAYVAFFDLGFYILDIRDPRQPKVLGQLALPGNSRGIAIQNNIAYIAAWQAGVHAVDITDPTKPTRVGNFDTNGYAWGVSVRDKNAYVMDWWGGVKTLDISNPKRITQTTSYHGAAPLRAIATRGQYVFAAAGKRGLQIFDGKNPLNPIWASALEMKNDATSLVVANDYAYVGGGNVIEIINISDAYRPTRTGEVVMLGNIHALHVFNQTLCALDETGSVSIYAIATNGMLTREFHAALNARQIASNNDACFAAGDRIVYKISRIENQWRSSELLRASETLLAADNNALFMLGADNQIVVYDSTQPNRLKEKIVNQFPVTKVIVEEDRFFVLSAGNGVQVFDAINGQYIRGEYYTGRHQIISGIKKDNALLFAGETALVSMELLPKFEIIGAGAIYTVSVPANTPQGNYDFVMTLPNGTTNQYRNAFKVGFPPPKKQRFTMDDLKKKMQQKNFDGRAPNQ